VNKIGLTLLAILLACSSKSGDTNTGGDAGSGSGSAAPLPFTKIGTGEYETEVLADGVIYGYGAGGTLIGQGSYQGLCIPARPIDVPAGTTFIDVQGGLHQSIALDSTGHVWTWGESDSGLQGGGSDGWNGTMPFQIQTDIAGNPFDHVVGVEALTGTGQYDVAWKDDGSIWLWGDLQGGLAGDGSADAIVEKPQQVPLPAGVKIIKATGAYPLLALADDGTVWTWGDGETNVIGNGLNKDPENYTPTQVPNLPANIVDIAVGFSSFEYALTGDGDLWGWGYRGGYLGLGSGFVPTPEPIDLKAVLSLPDKAVAVVADMMTTHVILADGTLWGWGDDAMGLVGDGHELDFATTNPPYAWDFKAFDLGVWSPVQIAPSVTNFVKIFAHSPYDFYDYAETADGKLYSWGRNKTGTLGNGVYGLAANGDLAGTSSVMEANYPNSWDVTSPMEVNPLTATPMGVNSPYCVANPTGSGCD
jgi:alpha-tubulin suppressor-like RCC1 family protein